MGEYTEPIPYLDPAEILDSDRNAEEEDDEELEKENVEDEDQEEENEEDDGEDEEYTLRFENEMNPLDFIEDDVFGIQPYQQFEKFEYEALAQRKRKALSEHPRTKKKSRLEDDLITNIDQIMEGMNYGLSKRRSRKSKRRGGRRSKNKLSPQVIKKLGEANFHYAKRQHEDAIRVLKEIVMLAPNLSETYHTLGLVYEEIGDKKKATNFYMLAAHLAPKDHPSLWRWLITLSLEQGNTGQATHCLNKAIMADPQDISLRLHRAALYTDLGEYQKAAETYHHILGIQPDNVEALKMMAEMYKKSNQVDKSITILEEYIDGHSRNFDISVVNLLVSIHMENSAYDKALEQIEHMRSVLYNKKKLPMNLTVMEGICKVHLGNLEDTEISFNDLRLAPSEDVGDLITKVADAFMNLGHNEVALKYYLMIQGSKEELEEKGSIHLKIARCYMSMREREKAIKYFYQALCAVEDNVDARLTLASLLLEEGKEDEAITLLSPPKDIETKTSAAQSKPWWTSGKVVMRLAQIYHAKGMIKDFVEAILPCMKETLSIESLNQKLRPRKKIPQSILSQRAKILDDRQVGSLFHGYRPMVAPSEMQKAWRAKKSLVKKAALKEEKKAACLAAGLDGYYDDSDDESLEVPTEPPPLPMLLKENEHYQLILDLCKALASVKRYWEAISIVNSTLRLTCTPISFEKKEELRLLGAQIAYKTEDPAYAYDYARESVRQHPYSFTAWNRYYKVISKLEGRLSKHTKLLLRMRTKHKDCLPPMMISGHQFNMISQHQTAAGEYLEAYKLQPDNPLINLCAGTALINLALASRLQNKHQCLVQAFSFLYNNLSLCENSQEALYNFARACHHVGLVTLAVSFYEKVLATCEKDYPIPKLSNMDITHSETCKPGYCDLRKEAAYNLHLIYKTSGALDLARQVLRDHCTP